MNNNFNKDIRNKHTAFKEWENGLISKESLLLEVRKCSGKVRIAKSQIELHLGKEIKTNSKGSLGIYVNRKQEKKWEGVLWSGEDEIEIKNNPGMAQNLN